MAERTRLHRTVLITVVVVIGLYLWWFYPWFYMAEDIEGWVVDAHSGEPIEGVVVTANWELKRGTLGGDIPCGQAHVDEAVTDSVGRFYFARWGPKIRPIGCEIVFQDPQLLLFKSGYRFRRLQNTVSSVWNRGVVRRSQWNNQTIKMKLFEGTPAAYAQQLGNLSLSWAMSGEQCLWRKISRMIVASHRQAMVFKKIGVVTSLYTLENLVPYRSADDKCGAAVFVEEQLP